ncbi:glucose-6-phosphate isomerase [Brevibacterium sp. 5221]|uniref:Glucose-6-phosphate isomerase n=1 Tax=Brevibacterium rongguiense TaxID=2695267 RepID=A0A6N9H533_9MICO|nr:MULTISPECIES: glucose-6-phosphate isomerase [Brevibacterium]MYM19168.1 glucose-6-phosphate isomerase [Brevibacterium rongguiense]WAL40846.1 glucose-6-phosphate isomerase [Brevibacterium sp. BRM-1]
MSADDQHTTVSLGVRSEAEFDEQLAAILDARAASRIAAGDGGVWGDAASAEAQRRLGWTGLPLESVGLVERIGELRSELESEGLTRIVLAGMGGSSLGAEVIAATAGVPLTVLDTTAPDEVRRALTEDLAATVLIVASKSGTTVETDSHRRIFTALCAEAGLDPAARLIAITDPDTALAQLAEAEGWRAAFEADPTVGGRFAALSAFGLVPAGLAGAEVASLLAQAQELAPALAADSADNPAVRLGAFLGTAHGLGTEKLVIATTDAPIVGLGAWLEQLIAESTGKEGLGILPVAVESIHSPGFDDARPDAALLFIGSAVGDHQPLSEFAAAVAGPLGAQFLLWETAVAIAGYSIGINPFDQPDVEAAKANARALLEGAAEGDDRPVITDGAVDVVDSHRILADVESLRGALDELIDRTDEYGYIAIQAYLDRGAAADAQALRDTAARATGFQTTFGWGPRYLHSTGQYHKGGHPNGSFIQLIAAPEADVEVPGTGFTLGRLQEAQAAGDAEALHGRPLITIRLREVEAGLAQVRAALEALDG